MYQHNPVVWFEIYVNDMPRARAFYEAVLGKTLEPLAAPDGGEGGGPPLEMFAFPSDMNAPGCSGALVKMDGISACGGGTLVYFHCDDCAVEAGRVEGAGGKLERPKMSIGEYGHIALAADTEGNMIGFHSMK